MVMNVLFLCTGNSARSILAEAILQREGAGRFGAFSAGSSPKDKVHPYAIDLLRSMDHATDEFRSKSWSEFATPEAPHLDLIFTVCDNAANEVCPIWPGHPLTVHWGIADPAAATGSEAERRQAFVDAHRRLSARISALVALPLSNLDNETTKHHLAEIGRLADADAERSSN
jgi:arsenate reductase